MRVIVAEDTMLTREGIVRLLGEAKVEVVAEVEDAGALIRQVRLERPDVAIVDIRMPPTHTDEGLVAAQQIRREHPETGVLLLSHYVEPSYALRLLEERPEQVGYLLKERVFDIAILIDALRRITDGESVVDPTIVSRLLGRKRRDDPLADLTPREREVLGPRRGGTLERGDRSPAVRHRTHGRSAREAGLPETAIGREPGVAPARPRRPRLPGRGRVGDGQTLWPAPGPAGVDSRGRHDGVAAAIVHTRSHPPSLRSEIDENPDAFCPASWPQPRSPSREWLAALTPTSPAAMPHRPRH